MIEVHTIRNISLIHFFNEMSKTFADLIWFYDISRHNRNHCSRHTCNESGVIAEIKNSGDPDNGVEHQEYGQNQVGVLFVVKPAGLAEGTDEKPDSVRNKAPFKELLTG